VRRRPDAVLSLGEIEKAHPDVFNALLQGCSTMAG
jgi:ATP-dependent Clp protease ATP-binding subunit ClpA